MIEKYIK